MNPACLVLLVTGGTGFAGSHLVAHLLTHHPAVAAWGHPGGRAVPEDGRPVAWRQVDVLDRPAVLRAIEDLRPSAVYHCAGFADVGAAWTDPAGAMRVNVLGTHHVLDAVRAAGLTCPVLVVGSAMVYTAAPSPLKESDAVVPATPYGVSKLAQEMLASRQAGGPVFLVRPFNHAGPRQSDAFVTSSFARQIAAIEAGRTPPVLRVGNLESERDITDVRDTVRAYRLVVERGQPGQPYNVCTGRAYRIRDLLDRLVAQAAARITVELDPSRLRPSDNPRIVGDPSRLTADTGWTAEIPIERTLADLLDGWRRHFADPSSGR